MQRGEFKQFLSRYRLARASLLDFAWSWVLHSIWGKEIQGFRDGKEASPPPLLSVGSDNARTLRFGYITERGTAAWSNAETDANTNASSLI